MNAESYQSKKVITTGDSNSKSDQQEIGKSSIYQHPFFIVASSLLALLVWIAVTGKNDGQSFTSTAYETNAGEGALEKYQTDTGNVAFLTTIFGDAHCGCNTCVCDGDASFCDMSKSCTNTCCILGQDCPCNGFTHCTRKGGDMYNRGNSGKKGKVKCCAGLKESKVTCRGTEICSKCL